MQPKSIGIRFDYLHAERLQVVGNQAQVTLNVNVSVGNNPTGRGEYVEIPFVAAVVSSPTVVNISVRGILVVQLDQRQVGEVIKATSEGKLPQYLQSFITQYVFFEVSLLLRELGMPPVVLGLPQGDKEGSIRYA
jgi:hypothetical protein